MNKPPPCCNQNAARFFQFALPGLDVSEDRILEYTSLGFMNLFIAWLTYTCNTGHVFFLYKFIQANRQILVWSQVTAPHLVWPRTKIMRAPNLPVQNSKLPTMLPGQDKTNDGFFKHRFGDIQILYIYSNTNLRWAPFREEKSIRFPDSKLPFWAIKTHPDPGLHEILVIFKAGIFTNKGYKNQLLKAKGLSIIAFRQHGQPFKCVDKCVGEKNRKFICLFGVRNT